MIDGLTKKQVIAARHRPCPMALCDRQHTSGVQFVDKTTMQEADAIALIEAGGMLYMIPTEGSPAFEASKALGVPMLLIQVKTCELCNTRVLYA